MAYSFLDHNSELHEEIERETCALHEKLQAIKHLLASDIDLRDDFVLALNDLRKTLSEHFTNEKLYGFFAEVISIAPHLKDDADLLCVTHRDMLHTAAELARFAANGSSSMPWWRELCSRFNAFADQVVHHDIDAKDLLQRTHQDACNAM